eukprot:CAMPEP_0168343528 /NCGR_PEP_ID=MMETSP0213-20121227/16158_1 /TAXON_ID=151035 /ORGANISM="Euplotes harpa, Strain FSP1.4" /LENGTH=129 /DNA_ID=CAMNT_0008350863 /DNA_START=8 /DNA_END=397 /DNA_ORIENTATION=+
MARKKSRKVARTVTKAKVDTVFDCPFCNDNKTVEVSIDNSQGVANIKCRVCLAKFQTEIHHLTQPIDVYCEWIDECEKLNKKGPEETKEEEEYKPKQKEEEVRLSSEGEEVENKQREYDDEEDDDDEYD